MQVPNAALLLRTWEETSGTHLVHRALALLDVVWPEVGLHGWSHAPIGTRDACLLELREALFGGELETISSCPHCQQRVEAAFRTGDIQVRAAVPPEPAEALLHWRDRDFEVDFRLPNSEDLLAISHDGDGTADAATHLLRRCVTTARRRGAPVDAADLPTRVVERVSREMQERDAGAELCIELQCPGCNRAWSATFDIVAYLWSEIEDWAQRLLADVHVLATSYGWSEGDILALSPMRRQMYLDMVRA